MNYNRTPDFLETAEPRPPQQVPRGNQGLRIRGISKGDTTMKKSIVPPAEPEQEPEAPKKPEGGKKFRITYRSEVYITAANEAEAREKFEALDLTSKEGNSRFVEEVSFEPQD